ncbi:unnamed protein product [Rotaria sordida]|uniref:Uncharacterized protein n=1 Tax=Rotaria sordida TaxID=392033 RepID=A0A815VNT8_9BILA|nr:unnamed protein product [Rotaria sordida]
MSPKSRRQLQAQAAVLRRHESHDEELSEEEAYGDVIHMNLEEDDDDLTNSMNFKNKFDLLSIGDMFELSKRKCSLRKISVLLYMILRNLGHTWRDIDTLLRQIGGSRCEAAHKWADRFLEGDFDALEDDRRGGKHSDGFYDLFPELETEAKAFVIESCSRKSSGFSTVDLAKYLDKRRWGATFKRNSQRPYFIGHERQDVIKHREEFVSYFLTRKDRYYTVSDGEQPVWNIPAAKPCILICKCHWSEYWLKETN